MSGQLVDVALGFNLPVSLSDIGSGTLSVNPVAGFIVSLLAFLVFVAVVGVPISTLFGAKLFSGLDSFSRQRSLTNEFDVSSVIQTITGNRALEDFLNEPLDAFVERMFGSPDGARSLTTVEDVFLAASDILLPLISTLDYDNTFLAIPIPGNDCRQKLMCHVHSLISKLPDPLQQAYDFIGPAMQNYDTYSEAIITGLSGGDCDAPYRGCPYSLSQLASFVPFLKGKSQYLGSSEL
ncbi:uncharacterized protein LOC135219473 [Macrobrachium nipponense]|uniref:uncharacterized protein LOC135219473 n=1 Tax=Macrobrachium nipponense TaxID=159736 RepID=UPI0030C7DD7B